MACDTCGNSQINSNNYLPYNFGNLSQSVNCNSSDCESPIDTHCVLYSGIDFTCLPNTNKDLQSILQAIDSSICENSGGIPWDTFDYSCLVGITNAQTFAEIVSAYICDLNDQLSNLNIDIQTQIDNINIDIDGIINPEITSCSYINIEVTDTLEQIINKQNTAICDLDSRLDISGVTWNQCYTVLTPPTTLPEAFEELIDQICTLKSSIPSAVTLPTFDNTETCLPSPTISDTLVNTINKIITVLCSKPSFNPLTLTPFSCGGAAGVDLQSTIENMRARITLLVNASIQEVGPGLVLEDIAAPEACDGKRLSLDFSLIPDEKVASNSSDGDPGFLIDKLEAGSNIFLDDITTPGKIIISSSAVTDVKVKTSALDPLAGYLVEKLTGGSDIGITLNITENISNPLSYQAQITPVIDWEAIAEKILLTIKDSVSLTSLFCSIDCESAASCAPPSNFSVEWSAPNFSVGYGAPSGVTSITVYYREKGDPIWLSTPGISPTNPQPPINASDIEISGLDPLKIYEFKVTSLCEAGDEADSATLERMSFAALSPDVTPSSQSIEFDFGTNADIDSVHMILRNANTNVIVGTQQSIGPNFIFNFTSLSASTNYNPEYYYIYTLNGVQYSSADASQHGSNYILSTVSTTA